MFSVVKSTTNNLWNMFDDMFEAVSPLTDWDWKSISYPCPVHPSLDLYVQEDGSLVFNFALPGYSKDDVEISFDEDYLVLTSKAEKDEKEKDRKYIRKFLRKESFAYKYIVPSGKFLQEKAQAEFKDGLLSIVIPPVKEKKKVSVKIN